MRTIWILAACFMILLLAPIIFAAIYHKKRKGSVLRINQDKVRDARFFGRSFAEMVESHLDTAEDGVIQLHREEAFWDADTETDYENMDTMDTLVIARDRPFYAPENVRIFEKEIYSAKNVELLFAQTELRAVYTRQKAIIGDGVLIDRWADAEDTLTIYDNCNLGISVSAGQALCVGHNCVFRRMYAPMIRIGQYPDSTLSAVEGRDPRIWHLPVQINKENNVRSITNERIDDDGIVNFTVVSPYKVTVTEELIVQGDIRSHRGVRICDDAVVCGNIFAEGDVRLGRNATVLGNVFSQRSIYLEERACVGQQGKISSVIAREDITFERDNFVFGYVSCERDGLTMELPEEERETNRTAFHRLPTPRGLEHLMFASLDEYEHVDWQGYRKEPALEDVVLPAGARNVQRSMFFDCPKLREVFLPNTLEVIEDYAFADCRALRQITDLGRLPLYVIGTSAFENCALLERADFPSTLTFLGGAAFAGCTALRWVHFPQDSRLETVEAHCFRGCGFAEIRLPDTVTSVGVSAFADCDALRYVSVPETCAEEPGIRELAERGVIVDCRPVPKPETAQAEGGQTPTPESGATDAPTTQEEREIDV